jgi:mannose-1-phosphate guanylyltransferase
MNNNNYVAIMAGGIGSRFWPVSRTNYPKQFLDILGTGKTLIQWTFERYEKFIPTENIFVITSVEYVELVKQQLPNIPVENILAEPSRKNTAPCIAYITYKLAQKNKDACLVCAPADHLILDTDTFMQVTNSALQFAANIKSIVTIGIKPNHPNTGYGYIQYEQLAVAESVHKVKTFTEKPNLELAKTFLESGDFLWNGGIFVFDVNSMLIAFEKYLPELHEIFVTETQNWNTPNEQSAIDRIYPQCTSISIDNGIMEKADNVYVIPADFGWSDLGTWNSAYDNLEKDYYGNAATGKNVMVIDAENCMIHAPNDKLHVLQGLKDYIVIDTKDVLLICKKEKEQEIKEYVAEVKRNKGDKFL